MGRFSESMHECSFGISLWNYIMVSNLRRDTRKYVSSPFGGDFLPHDSGLRSRFSFISSRKENFVSYIFQKLNQLPTVCFEWDEYTRFSICTHILVNECELECHSLFLTILKWIEYNYHKRTLLNVFAMAEKKNPLDETSSKKEEKMEKYQSFEQAIQILVILSEGERGRG